MTYYDEIMQRTEWFRQARFGMFIHWGLYAIPARGEWVRSREKICRAEYHRYFEEFNPQDYDPRQWARLAKAAGMKYVVMTAKHHDGFCLFDSAYTNFKSTNTACGRDLVREYLEAFRAEGLRVGLYYSLLDWEHSGYPHFGDLYHPQRDDESVQTCNHDFSSYLDYMHAQIRELCSNYGKLDILWFDFSYPGMAGEKWRASELVQMVRNLQPDVIIDNRLECSGDQSNASIRMADPKLYAGDFASPEMIIPPQGVTDNNGKPLPWESCITMNYNWGYNACDNNFKPAKVIIRRLVECVSKNGNMLLNVGPDARGRIPQQCCNILAEVGDWLKDNGVAIYNCSSAAQPKPEWGYLTQNENHLFAHVFDVCIGPVALPGLNNKIKKARLLKDGSELPVGASWNTEGIDGYAFINWAASCYLPDERDTVIALTLN